MSWKELFIEEMQKPYFKTLTENVKNLYRTKTIFKQSPALNNRSTTPFPT